MSKITNICWVGTSIKLKKFARLGCLSGQERSYDWFQKLSCCNVLCLFFWGGAFLDMVGTPMIGTVKRGRIRTSKGFGKRKARNSFHQLHNGWTYCDRLIVSKPSKKNGPKQGIWRAVSEILNISLDPVLHSKEPLQDNKKLSQDRGCDHVAF